jgi:hypothetical protein
MTCTVQGHFHAHCMHKVKYMTTLRSVANSDVTCLVQLTRLFNFPCDCPTLQVLHVQAAAVLASDELQNGRKIISC